MEEKILDEIERQREELTVAFLREQVKKLAEKEPAWERILKSSVSGVILGALLTLAANYVLERSRAQERARDAEQQRLQGTLQIVDDLAALVYEHRTQAGLLAIATSPTTPFDKKGLAERKASYEAAYTKFATQVPVTLLKLRSRIEPKYYKVVVKSFEAGVQSSVETVRDNMSHRYRMRMPSLGGIENPVINGDPGDYPDPTFRFLQTSGVCSDAVINFTYAAAESLDVEDAENHISQACGWTRATWAKLKE